MLVRSDILTCGLCWVEWRHNFGRYARRGDDLGATIHRGVPTCSSWFGGLILLSCETNFGGLFEVFFEVRGVVQTYPIPRT